MNLISRLVLALTLATPYVGSLQATEQIQPTVEQTQPETPQVPDAVLAQIKELTTKIPEHTHSLRLIITALIQKIEADNLKDLDKKNIRTWALAMQQCLQDIQAIPNDSAPNLVLKSLMHEHCIEILTKAVQHKFKNLPPFTPELMLKRSTNHGFDLEQLITLQNTNGKALSSLESKIRNVGLSKINKIARGIDSLVKKTKVGSLLKWGLLLGGGAFIYKQFNSPKTNELPVFNDTKKPLTDGIMVHDFMSQMSGNALGATAALVGQTLLHNSKDIVLEKWHSAKNASYALWNRLKGQQSVLDIAGFKIVDNTTLTLNSEELIGLEEQIKQVSPILECALDLEGFVSRGNKPQYGTLLVGPSGCGKTQFARALSGTIRQIFDMAGKTTSVSFKEINCWEFRFASLRSFITEARKQGGVVVLFIDEIHNLNMQTTRDTSALNEFLTQMSDLYNSDDPNSHVFLIAATNQPELLGTSLLVPGRFGKIIHFDYPNTTKRQAFFNTLLPRTGVNLDEIDVESLVRQTNNHISFGKLRAIINEARIKAASNQELVGQKHLQAVVDTIVHRFTHTNDLTASEKNVVAAHQAGKALTHVLLKTDKKLERVTIGGINNEIKEINEFNGATDKHDPNKGKHYKPRYGALIAYDKNEMLSLTTQEEQEKQCKILLAGVCSQDLCLGTHSMSYRTEDLVDASQLAVKIVLDGTPFEALSKKRQEEVKESAEQLIARYKKEMAELLQQNSVRLKQLVSTLESQITIAGSDVEKLVIRPYA